MSTSENKFELFMAAKAEFLEQVRNVPVTEGFVYGLSALDASLVAVLGLAIEAGLGPRSAEVKDVHAISLLLTDQRVPEDTWLTAIGPHVPTSQPSEIGMANATRSGGDERSSNTGAGSPDPTNGTQEISPHIDPLSIGNASAPSHAVDNIHSPTTLEDMDIPRSDEMLKEGGQAGSESGGESTKRVELVAYKSVKEDIGGKGGEALEQDGSVPAVHTSIPEMEQRATTGGKSVSVLQTSGLMGRKRVRLLLGEREEGRQERQEEMSSGDEIEVELPKSRKQGRSQRKKRRIASAATVDSDDESRGRRGQGLVVENRKFPGWKTKLSEESCLVCAGVGVVCESFVLRGHGHPRFACCRCHDLKKMCEFTKPRRLAHVAKRQGGVRTRNWEDDEEADGGEGRTEGKMKSKGKRSGSRQKSMRANFKKRRVDESSGSEEEEEEDAEKRRRGRKATKKDKGKGKERRRSPSREWSPIKFERDEALEAEMLKVSDWLARHGEAGPSSGQIRTRVPTATEVAELYARLREVESSNNALVDATAVSLQEIRGDVARMESNQETQKKYVLKELVRVEGVARDAEEKCNGVQEQVDCVRQQTKVMAESMNAMQRHSDQLTKGLGEILVGFREMRFELPTKFDDWLTVRLGQAGGTVSGEGLQWNSGPRLPAILPIMDPNTPAVGTSQGGIQASETEGNPVSGTTGIVPAPPTSPHHSSSSRPSSTELYRTYLHQQSSHEDLIVDMARSQETAGMGNNGDEVQSTPEIVRSWNGIEDVSNVGDTMDVDEDQGVVVMEDDDGQRPGSGTEENGSLTQLKGSEEMAEGRESIQDRETTAASPDINTGGLPFADADEGLPLSQGGAPQHIEPDPLPFDSTNDNPAPIDRLSPTPPTSPEIVQAKSVSPPPGMLLGDFHFSPPSSQPTMPSPSPLPNPSRLAVVDDNRALQEGGHVEGPVTRSRSRSRSPYVGVLPPNGNPYPRVRTPRKKPTSGQGKPISRQG